MTPKVTEVENREEHYDSSVYISIQTTFLHTHPPAANTLVEGNAKCLQTDEQFIPKYQDLMRERANDDNLFTITTT